jgi:glycosyltransferase involved in cell wall biosynthesis
LIPLVTIIIPTYNRENIICETIDSIIQQSFINWECLIIDDYSDDNTFNLINKYILYDKRFKYSKNIYSKGAQGARNTGIELSNGKYLIFFDSDNLMQIKCLESLYNNLMLNNADISTCFSLVFDKEKNIKTGEFNWINEGNIHNKLIKWETYVDNSSALIDKNIINNIGRFDEECPSFQEMDLHIRLSEIANYTTIKEKLVIYNTNNTDSISSDVIKSINGYFFLIFKYEKKFKQNIFSYLNIGLSLYRLIDKLKDKNLKTNYKKQLLKTIPIFRFKMILSFILYIHNKFKLI